MSRVAGPWPRGASRVCSDGRVASEENDPRDAAAHAGERSRRSATAKRVLAAAAERDDQADARDAAAEERDGEASKKAFLNRDAGEHDHQARRSAALDRLDSKSDRSAAASDRSQLTEDA